MLESIKSEHKPPFKEGSDDGLDLESLSGHLDPEGRAVLKLNVTVTVTVPVPSAALAHLRLGAAPVPAAAHAGGCCAVAAGGATSATRSRRSASRASGSSAAARSACRFRRQFAEPKVHQGFIHRHFGCRNYQLAGRLRALASRLSRMPAPGQGTHW
jgi:hypothetical protein